MKRTSGRRTKSRSRHETVRPAVRGHRVLRRVIGFLAVAHYLVFWALMLAAWCWVAWCISTDAEFRDARRFAGAISDIGSSSSDQAGQVRDGAGIGAVVLGPAMLLGLALLVAQSFRRRRVEGGRTEWLFAWLEDDWISGHARGVAWVGALSLTLGSLVTLAVAADGNFSGSGWSAPVAVLGGTVGFIFALGSLVPAVLTTWKPVGALASRWLAPSTRGAPHS